MTDPNDENIALKTDIEEQDIQSLEPDAISSPAQPRPPPPQRSLSRRESIKLNLVQYKDEVSKEKIACVNMFIINRICACYCSSNHCKWI
eukprot:697283_1